MGETVSTPDGPVKIDDARQRGTEHNHKAFCKELHEAGFPKIVTRALSPTTIALHTRTLTHEEQAEFEAWAEANYGLEPVRTDHEGDVYLVPI